MALGNSWVNVASGTFTSGGATLVYYIDAKLNSQSVANNSSTIATRARTKFTGYVMGGAGYSMSCTGCTTDSGNGVIYYNNPVYTNNQTYHTYEQTVLTGTTTVTHNADGTKSFSMSGACSNTYLGMNITVSGSVALPTIPRASKPTVSTNPLTIGDTQVISTNRASTSFTHRITIEMGGYLQMYTDVGASVSWLADPELLMPYMDESYERTMTVTCVTYNGSTSIGTQSTTFKLRVDTSTYKPVIGSATLTDSNAVTSSLETSGTFIKGKSNLVAQIPLSVNSTTYGDTLKSARVVYGDTVTDYTLTNPIETITFNAVADATTMVVTATDNRGYSVSKSVTVNVLDYSDISPISVSYKRVTQNNVESETGEYIRYIIEATAFLGSFGQQTNTITVKSRSKAAIVPSYNPLVTEQTVTTSGNGMDRITITGVSQGTYDSTGQFDVQFVLEDLLSTVTLEPMRVHEGVPVYAWGKDFFEVFGSFHTHDREDTTEYLSYGLDYNDTKSDVLAYTHGYITSSGQVAVLFVPFTMLPLDPEITSLLCSVRSADGSYLGGNNNTNLKSQVESITALKEQSALRILLRNTSGYGITNNTPLCGEVTISYRRKENNA